MFGKLEPDQIEELLKSQITGRIGCHADGETYVVPISYAYDDVYIYCHTYEGKKMMMMRKNPQVCFQVDDMQNMANWRSIIVQGDFEEIHDNADRASALQVLLSRHLPLNSSITTHLGKFWPFNPKDTSDIPGLVFRIKVKEKTGRYESASATGNIPG